MFPKGVHIQERVGLADHDPDRETAYLALESNGTERAVKYLTLLLPQSLTGDSKLPVIIPLEGEEWIGVQILEGESQPDVYINLRADGSVMHRNSIKNMDGWETDDYLFAVTRLAKEAPSECSGIQRMFIGYESFLRHGGKTFYSSLSKSTAVYSWSDSCLQVSITGQPTGTVEILPLQQVTSVKVNEADPVMPTYNRDGRIVLDYHTAPLHRRPG